VASERTSVAPGSRRQTTLRERVEHYGTKTVEPVRSVRASLAAEAVPYQVQGREIRVNPRLLSYWIPFLLGVGVMVGGMKTAGVPLIGIPQLLLGVVLIAVTTWDFVSDSGRLDVKPPPLPARQAPEPPPSEWTGTVSRRSYAEELRRNAVEMVLTGGKPVAAVARELDISPSTLGRWVNNERQARAERGEPADEDTIALPPARTSG
jgi:hypothetical protein